MTKLLVLFILLAAFSMQGCIEDDRNIEALFRQHLPEIIETIEYNSAPCYDKENLYFVAPALKYSQKFYKTYAYRHKIRGYFNVVEYINKYEATARDDNKDPNLIITIVYSQSEILDPAKFR